MGFCEKWQEGAAIPTHPWPVRRMMAGTSEGKRVRQKLSFLISQTRCEVLRLRRFPHQPRQEGTNKNRCPRMQRTGCSGHPSASPLRKKSCFSSSLRKDLVLSLPLAFSRPSIDNSENVTSARFSLWRGLCLLQDACRRYSAI